MNPELSATASNADAYGRAGRLESVAFYVFLVTVILAPIAFWPSEYFAIDLAKTIVIILGSLAAAILLGFVAIKERKMVLPTKSLTTLGIFLTVSILISSLASIHAAMSLIGQGFELGTVGFILACFVSAIVAFTLVVRKRDRVIVIYAGMTSVFLLLFTFQLLRVMFGQNFATLSVLKSLAASVFGSWSSLGIYSALIAILTFTAIYFLPLSRKVRYTYWIILVLSAVMMFAVNSMIVWQVSASVFLGLAIFLSIFKYRSNNEFTGSWIKRLAWLPICVFVVFAFFSCWGSSGLARPVLISLNLNNPEILLPWQLSLDVVSGSIKNYPIFGVGPNHFAQAYLAYKPDVINTSDGWGIEFNTGFGLIPTFVVAQGLVGTILWVLFLVFFGIIGIRTLKRLPSDRTERFIIVSSFAGAVFLWIMMIVTVPTHVPIFLTFVLTGIFVGSAYSSGLLPVCVFQPVPGSRVYKFMPSLVLILIVIAALWGLLYVKKTAALSYLASGLSDLKVTGGADAADADFAKASAIDSSDAYWRARVESSLSKINEIAAAVNSQMTASATQAMSDQVVKKINLASSYADKAIAYDPTNYYNYLSRARLFEVANSLKIPSAYDAAVKAYTAAIGLNPKNPSLYLSLARLQAGGNKYDDSIKTIGATLQVKNNYIDAIFLLSQVSAAKGDLPQAISAAQYAIQLNPQNPLLYFQLGLLQYNGKDYASAADALNKAVTIQSDYANARYFLGLSLARLGRTSDAIQQFKLLAAANPDNQEVTQILTRLQSGKSIFADLQVASAPEKRATLPIKHK